MTQPVSKPNPNGDYDPRPWLKAGHIISFFMERAWEPADRVFKATGWGVLIATLDAFRSVVDGEKLRYLVAALWLVWTIAVLGQLTIAVDRLWNMSTRRFGWPPSEINEHTNFFSVGTYFIALLCFAPMVFVIAYADRAIADVVTAILKGRP